MAQKLLYTIVVMKSPRFLKRFLWLLLVGFLPIGFVGTAWSYPAASGREGDFLSWGAGARALALGKAYVALATDATASYWNPAGLAFAEFPEVSALHAALWEGTQYEFLGVALPTMAGGTFGGFGSVLATPGLERRDDENNVLSGTFNSSKAGLGVAYAWSPQPGWGAGITLKWLGRWFDQEPTGFFTFDLGVRFEWASWGSVGVVLQHAAAARYGDTSDGLPAVLRAGLVIQPLADLGRLVADGEWVAEERVGRWRLGWESAFFGPLVVRAGLDGGELAGGLGVRIDALRVDYAGAWHTLLGMSHRFAVATTWGESRWALRGAEAEAAFAKAVEALAEANASGDPEIARAARENARAALDTVLSVDPLNKAAGALRQRLETERLSSHEPTPDAR